MIYLDYNTGNVMQNYSQSQTNIKQFLYVTEGVEQAEGFMDWYHHTLWYTRHEQ